MRRTSIALTLLIAVIAVASATSFANDKKKPALPATVLNAKTVLVMLDPDAGISPTAPLANKTAVEDVEKAITKWGRYRLAMSTADADLVIVLRKGGKLVQQTVGGEGPNNRPVILQPGDGSIRIGGQKGQPPDGTQSDPQSTSPHPQTEVSNLQDSFAVYDGTAGDPIGGGSAPIWRLVAKNALHSPDVPAVDEFRKAVEEAEKQQQKQQKQQSQTKNP
ncbi:MAG TPA: hypothetical protein VKT53_06395 [Candidatus Acidoferrum sp.]|nr:hypothetical protein [Candidatus Acidoferrum sp.]